MEAISPESFNDDIIKDILDRWSTVANGPLSGAESITAYDEPGTFIAVSNRPEDSVCLTLSEGIEKSLCRLNLSQETGEAVCGNVSTRTDTEASICHSVDNEPSVPHTPDSFSSHNFPLRVRRDVNDLLYSPIVGIAAYIDDHGKIKCFMNGPEDSPYSGFSC